jgi:hypothetical protein
MKSQRNFRLGLALLIVICACNVAFAADKPDKKEILKQAQQSYYSLRGQGLRQFQCGLEPNWAALLGDMQKSDPDTFNRAVNRLNELRFTVVLQPDGRVKVTHTEIAAENDQVKRGLAQIYSGMEQVVTGFFETWSPFMLNNPIPQADSQYQLEDQGAQYRLSYKDGAADVVTTMGKDYVISEINVATAEFKSRMQPQFVKSAAGLLLSGYRAEYNTSKPEEATQLRVRLEYQSVNGLQLPQKLDLAGFYGGNPFQVEVKFTGCQAEKK